MSSQSSHHPQEVRLAQFSLYVHKGGLKPDSFYFFLCLSRYSHHSKLLTALDILPIEESIKSMSVSLMKRIFLVNSPVRSLCSFFMSKYLLTGKYSKKTLFGRLLDMGLSPLLSALSTFKYMYTQKYSARDGLVDSLQGVLYRPDFLNINSTAHIFTKLLTRF